MTKFLTAILVAMLLASVAAAQACQCPEMKCSCNSVQTCQCQSSAGKVCKVGCPCDLAFVTADTVETKACPADDSGTAFFLDGKQCGWLCHAEMKYYPVLPSGNFGAACMIPKGATATKPAVTISPSTAFDFGASGGSSCGPNGCGTSAPTRGFGFFRR
jgi:hypothetical protein